MVIVSLPVGLLPFFKSFNAGGKRACFLQRRYYLAILFCHLYQYNLCEAQGLCDHLVREILRRSQLSTGQMEEFSGMFTLPKSVIKYVETEDLNVEFLCPPIAHLLTLYTLHSFQ